ncbi:MAG: TonB family protein [Pseudomonadota bacterium]
MPLLPLLLALAAFAAPEGAPEAVAPPGTAPAGALAEPPPLVKEPALLDFVQAPYPAEAQAAGLEGTVVLAIEIDEAGHVASAEVLEPAGHGFDEAALEAARRFVFEPAEDETGPVAVIVEFAYGFVLDAAAHDGAVPDAQAPPPEAELPVTLEGQLTEMGTRRALEGFPVLLPALDMQTTTDAEGWFRFRGVPPGAHRLKAVNTGFDALEREVEVVDGEVTTLRLWIRNQSYAEDELVGVYKREKEEVTRRTLSVQEVRRVPGTFGDPVRVIQSLPGAARAPFSTGILVIRGSNPEDSAVYVDGIRIPLIYHLDGVHSVLNPNLVESVDYLPGGYGVRYGRSLGGAIDVRTRRTYPEEGHDLKWTTDLMHSGGLLSGRFGAKRGRPWGYAGGARRSYIDLLIPFFTQNSGFVIKPRWFDYQLKLDRLELPGGSRFCVFIFGFQDILRVSTPDDVAQGTDQDTQGDLDVLYSTHRLLVDWEHPLTERWKLRVTPSVGLDVNSGSMGSALTGGQDTFMMELRAEAPWEPSDHFRLTPGVDFIGGWWGFDVKLPFNPELAASYDPIGEREDWSIEDDGWAWGPDLYLDADLQPLSDPDRLLITPGVRWTNIWIPGEYLQGAPDPRISVRFRPWEKSAVKGAVGLYHQPPMPFEMYRPDDKQVQEDFERAVSTTVGWEQQVGEGWSGDLELFYKRLDQLLVMNDEFTSLDDPYFINAGRGRIYGLELMIKRAQVDRFFGWLSYTLSKSERVDYPDQGDDWYDFDFDQTHILVLVGGIQLPYDLELSTRVQYVTGNPWTPYAGGVYDVDQGYYWAYSTAARNSHRLPPYFAADLRFQKMFTFKRWQLTTYVDMLNVVRGTNPEMVRYNYDYTEWAYVRSLPFIPNVGFDANWRF